MISVEDAINIIISNSNTISECENINIFNILGRTISCDLKANHNIPPKNNSAMDGYAIKYNDTQNAKKNNPVKLKIIDEIQAGGENKRKTVTNGVAIRIMTGAHIPEGADAVIPFENTKEEDNIVNIYKDIKKNENIRFSGEDVSKGQTVLFKGTRIDSAQIGLIASLNMDKINVYKKPTVSIISTGDEIIELGSKNITDKTINSNAYTIYSEVLKYGGNPKYYGIVGDDREKTRKIIKKAMSGDIIITSGGVSMGRYDFIPEVMKDLGVDIKINKIKMKPGKPFIFGTKDNKLFFGLPGNPVSVMVSFIQFIRPAILKISGAEKINKPIVKALLSESIQKKPGRQYFIRGIYTIKENEFHVTTTGPQGSGILTSMNQANCLIILPEEMKTVKKGQYIDIQLINHGEIN